MDVPEPFLTTSDVVRLLQVHIETVYTLIAERGLPAAKIDRHCRFEDQKVRAWVETHYASLDAPDSTLSQKES